jgi:hypothetical protein
MLSCPFSEGGPKLSPLFREFLRAILTKSHDRTDHILFSAQYSYDRVLWLFLCGPFSLLGPCDAGRRPLSCCACGSVHPGHADCPGDVRRLPDQSNAFSRPQPICASIVERYGPLSCVGIRLPIQPWPDVGGLWHLLPGHPDSLQATVLATGRRHGKASHGHGAWIDLRLANQSRMTHLETQELFSFYSDTGDPRNYSCSLKTAGPFDVVRLVGRTSPLGFAVDRIVPVNERLIDACSKASGDPP